MENLMLPVGGALVGAAGMYLCLLGGKSPVANERRSLASCKRSDKSSYAVYRSNTKHYRVAADAEGEIRLSPSGIASVPPLTVMQQFAQAAKNKGDMTALRIERGGVWIDITWKQYYADTQRAARALMHLGLKPHQSVSIIGFNAPQWFVANMGAIAAGGNAAGIYTTSEPDACAYVVEHSESRVVVVENNAQLAKFLKVKDRLVNVSAIVVYNEDIAAGVDGGRIKLLNWNDFMALGDNVPVAQLAARIEQQRPGHSCTLIYTSGTTGNPKAVMMTHDNLTWTARSLFSIMPHSTFGKTEEHIVSYLPLSHIAAQMIDIHLPIAIAAMYPGNATVHFARPDALKGTLGDTLKACRPTIFFGVPRVWEKIMEKMKQIGESTTGLKKQLISWAKARGAEAYAAESATGDCELPFAFAVAQKLVLSKVRVALGLDRCNMCFTGAAPISLETLQYFGALYIPIMELYGMSECTGPQTVSSPGCYKAGSCGPCLPGTELKIDHDASRDRPGEGEICYRGRHIMLGYLKSEEKTREAIDNDGWLHSGDVGKLDSDGFLYITGRIKELLISAGGENIAPVPMENAIKAACAGLANVMMVGDRQKYNCCLVTLKVKPSKDTDGAFTNELDGEARTVDDACTTVAAARKSARWQAYIQAGIDKANKEAAVSRASRIQKFRILDGDFSIPGGELTATLKLRRKVCTEKYADVIAEMYQGGDE